LKGKPLFLEAAFEIGARLCRDALWHEIRCTWAGPATALVDGTWRTIPRVWGPDLYAGSAGNALFLARLHRATGERILRATAEGAARHALSLAGGDGGFYTGRAGIAYACLELGAIFGDERWSAAGLELLRSLPEAADDPVLDLVGGAAGELAALLVAWRRHGGQDLLAAALRRGELLLARARRRAEGFSWASPGNARDLTGLSHGATGIAWALLELFVATGDARFRGAALEGFRYERSCYDPRRENWPDFREPAGPAFPLHWCHGAPGIGLSRLRAWQLLGDPLLKAEAQAALRSTWRDLTSPRPDAENFSLCHGLAGNAELLVEAARVFADPAYLAAAEEVGRHGIELQKRNSGRVGSGLRGGAETPNLMLGSAGTGYFYLRLAGPEATPSILLPRQEG
jgi:lantibiotic modifying enzyme